VRGWLKRLWGGKAQDTGVNASGWEVLAGIPWIVSDNIWESYSTAEREKAYRNHAVIRACVQEIATSIADAGVEVGLQTPDGWEAAPAHPIADLLNSPNEFGDYNSLMQEWVSRLLLAGKSFIWKWRTRAGELAELWPVPTSWVSVKTGGTGGKLIDYYEVIQDRHQVRKVETEDMFYARFIDPSSVYDGVGPLQAALHDYQLDCERENYLVEMLTNLKVPGLTLKREPGNAPLSERQKADLRQSLHDIAGKGKRGGTPILPPGVSIEFPGILKDMDWPGFAALSESRICAAFAVPPILVGVRVGIESATYSNYATARKSFYTETLRPLWAALAGTLTRGLFRNEGEERLEIRFKLDDIPELQEDVNQRAKRAAELLRGGAITRNEARDMAGLEAVDDGDVYLLPINIVEQPVRSKPAEEPEE